MEGALSRIHARVMAMVSRCIVRGVNDGAKLQSLQVSLFSGELKADTERFQNYGVSSNPHPGAEGVAVFVGGNRDHALIIAVDDRRYRLQSLETGEVAIYTDEGDKIHLKRGNTVEVTTSNFVVNASAKITMTAPEIELNASTKVQAVTPLLAASADIVDMTAGVGGRSMGSMRTIYDSHTHNENNVAGGPTAAPNESM